MEGSKGDATTPCAPLSHSVDRPNRRTGWPTAKRVDEARDVGGGEDACVAGECVASSASDNDWDTELGLAVTEAGLSAARSAASGVLDI